MTTLLNRELFTRDPATAHLMNNGQARIADGMTFARYCFAHGWISEVPKVQKLATDDVMKGRPISQEEFDAMLKAVPAIVGERHAPSWKYTLKILWESTFRVGDAMDFSWDDERRIHPVWPRSAKQKPTLMIPPTQKNGKVQEIPMLPALRELLEETPKRQRRGWVINPEPIDHQVRSKQDWFRPTPKDLDRLASEYSNSAIGRACGVTETAVRKWLKQESINVANRTRAIGHNIPKKVAEQLRQRAEQHRAKANITSNQRLTKDHVGRAISRFGEEAGIVVQQADKETGRRVKYASAHDLRRGCAQRLINAGVSAETLKVVMRHRDFATTEKYYGATRAAQAAAAEIYDRLESDRNDAAQESSADVVARLSAEELRKLKALLNSI
jgi:integrase